MTKTYAQIAREIAALQATASKLYAIEVKSAVAKVNELVAKYGLSAGDLAFAAAPGGRGANASAPGAKPAVTASAAAGAKYSDGQGRVWGGRGPRPAWLRSAIAAGRSLESFLIAGAADVVAALTGSTGRPAKKAAAKKSAATGVAKYVNPKTGAGWSGRGPRPQWLKDALKKRGSKIEDFLGDKPASVDTAAAAPVAPAPAKKASAPAKKAVAKKIVAKKVSVKSAAGKAPDVATKSVAVAPAKKAAVKKTAVKKVAVKKVAAKAPAKKAPARKTTAPSAAPAAPAAPAAAPAVDASGSIA